MPQANSTENNVVYTIGHSNHGLDAFIDILRQHDIQVVIDVRSNPRCQYTLHFNRRALEESFEQIDDIRYVFMGDVLGGMPDADRFYDDDGYVLYGRLAESTQFTEGLERVISGAETYRVVLMCSEEDPTECHRRLLIGRVLEDEGMAVIHIRADGTIQSEQEVAEAERLQQTDGQQTLFEPEEDEWKSTQSVTGKSRQSSFLKPSNGPECARS